MDLLDNKKNIIAKEINYCFDKLREILAQEESRVKDDLER
jgi:hypothetical protein